MISSNNHWEIINRVYEILQDSQNLTEEQTVNADALTDYDTTTAADEVAYEITGARFPELAMLEAYAAQGYLDNDQIWDEIGEAISRAARAHAEEGWQEYQENVAAYEEDDSEE